MRFMRASRFIAPAFWLLALCCVACAQASSQKKRVAVLDFDNYSESTASSSKAFGADAADVGKGISAQIIEKLLHGGKYTVVERSEVKRLLEEQSISDADRQDVFSLAARIGRMLRLDALIVGAVTRFGPDATQKSTGGGRSGMSTRKSKAYVGITARVLDMTRAEVIAEFTVTGESARTGEVITFKASGHVNDTQEMLSGEFVDNLLAEAARNAVELIAEQLNSFAEKIPTLTVPMDGLVAEVTGNLLTLNLGKKSGVKVGDEFAIFRETRAVTEPQTGAALPPVIDHLGDATVTEVAELYCTATFSGTGEAHVGDHVKRLANSQTPPY
jgi:curli biogenesis system outer membrane secretion channel CsgG